VCCWPLLVVDGRYFVDDMHELRRGLVPGTRGPELVLGLHGGAVQDDDGGVELRGLCRWSLLVIDRGDLIIDVRRLPHGDLPVVGRSECVPFVRGGVLRGGDGIDGLHGVRCGLLRGFERVAVVCGVCRGVFDCGRRDFFGDMFELRGGDYPSVPTNVVHDLRSGLLRGHFGVDGVQPVRGRHLRGLGGCNGVQ